MSGRGGSRPGCVGESRPLMAHGITGKSSPCPIGSKEGNWVYNPAYLGVLNGTVGLQ